MSKNRAPMMQTRIVTITSKVINTLFGGPSFFLSSNSFVMDRCYLKKAFQSICLYSGRLVFVMMISAYQANSGRFCIISFT